jgi:hypothetical protein
LHAVSSFAKKHDRLLRQARDKHKETTIESKGAFGVHQAWGGGERRRMFTMNLIRHGHDEEARTKPHPPVSATLNFQLRLDPTMICQDRQEGNLNS